MSNTGGGRWHLMGYDTFAGEYYPIAGSWTSRQAAEKAAAKELNKLEKLQPTRDSGGQAEGGIQDRIFIAQPDGSMWRYFPSGQRPPEG
ncbi:MAG: hypothetical protein HZA50_16240 [Planctomycetes bacterium]|nr:hypothetical protein [Planctomycetota bacterium]